MSYKTLTKQIKAALDKGHLYNDEEYKILKQRYATIQKLRRDLINYEKAQRGFGYNYESVSEVGVGDTRSREDDGLRSESEQPEQPGESEG